MYAIVDIKSKQFKVSEGDTLYVPYQKDLDPGAEVTYDDVLLVSDDGDVQVGSPVLGGASVQARVLDHVKDDKVTVFKFKKRKRYRVKRGHRQPYTQIEVEGLTVGEAPERAVREEEHEEEAARAQADQEVLEESAVEQEPEEESAPEALAEAEAPEAEAEEADAPPEIEAPSVDELEDLVDRAVEEKVIERAGSWYKYQGETLGQGKTAAAESLRENPEVLDEVRSALGD